MNAYKELRHAAETAVADLKTGVSDTGFIVRYLQRALKTPRRNCDVGTAEEQEKRWQTNCGHGIPNCKHCKVFEQARKSGLVHRRYLMSCDCRFIWSQMPYESEVK